MVALSKKAGGPELLRKALASVKAKKYADIPLDKIEKFETELKKILKAAKK